MTICPGWMEEAMMNSLNALFQVRLNEEKIGILKEVWCKALA